MTDAPFEAASALVQRVYPLLLEAHQVRQGLIAMQAADADEAERQVHLGLVSALEDGLRRSLEEAVAMLKAMKGDAAEAWLRRRLEGVERGERRMTEARTPKPQRPREGELVPAVDPVSDAYEGTALALSVITVLGSAVSTVLGGWARERQYERVREAVTFLDEAVGALTADQENYVRTEEFEDLLDQTLRRVATERHEAKRRLYAALLAGAIQRPGAGYDEHLRFMRTIEQLQRDHVRVIQAMLQMGPSDPPRGLHGSIKQTLQRRLPGMPGDRISDLYGQLTTELRIVEAGGFDTMMTAGGAENLSSRFTRYGQRFIQYVRAAGLDEA
jgi:hypothetical protein